MKGFEIEEEELGVSLGRGLGNGEGNGVKNGDGFGAGCGLGSSGALCISFHSRNGDGWIPSYTGNGSGNSWHGSGSLNGNF